MTLTLIPLSLAVLSCWSWRREAATDRERSAALNSALLVAQTSQMR